MCGIAGIVGAPGDSRIDSAIIHRMCQTIIHRGPDDEGLFVKSGAGLGMRRLSIIDLSGGHQPVFNEDRTVWIVFNGEIYNFRELRRDLENQGHHFRTRTDTEVIVHLYEEFGSDCVQQLRGMFAFALFDETHHRLILARDRLGQKPLHYALFGDQLLFGSEMKAILSAAPQLADVDSEALLQYFYFGYIPDPRTAFHLIKKLPPGHLLEFQSEQVRIRKYWDLPTYGTYSPPTESDCLDELEEHLSEAVRLRLMADVPLGAFLSGGTDSSTIVAIMARLSTKPIKTFSIGFQHADLDETPYARLVATKFSTEHHELILEPEVVETVQILASSLEEPFGDSSMLPTYYISRLARKHVTVALSGDGGDEAFGGYDRYRKLLQNLSHRWIPTRMRRWYREQLYPRLPFGFPGRNVAYSISLPWAERYIEGISLAPYQRNFSLISDEFLTAVAVPSDPASMFRHYLENSPAGDCLSQVLYLDSKTYLPGDILTKVDRMSMIASLEARAPMLDHIFLEWITSVTPEWKMGKRGQKYILTKLAERLGVPRDVLHRPKQGFALPLRHWLRQELKELTLSLLLDSSTIQRGYFNQHGIRRYLNSFFAGHTDDYLPIWRLIMFELWHRQFLEPLKVLTTGEHPNCAADVCPRIA